MTVAAVMVVVAACPVPAADQLAVPYVGMEPPPFDAIQENCKKIVYYAKRTRIPPWCDGGTTLTLMSHGSGASGSTPNDPACNVVSATRLGRWDYTYKYNIGGGWKFAALSTFGLSGACENKNIVAFLLITPASRSGSIVFPLEPLKAGISYYLTYVEPVTESDWERRQTVPPFGPPTASDSRFSYQVILCGDVERKLPVSSNVLVLPEGRVPAGGQFCKQWTEGKASAAARAQLVPAARGINPEMLALANYRVPELAQWEYEGRPCSYFCSANLPYDATQPRHYPGFHVCHEGELYLCGQNGLWQRQTLCSDYLRYGPKWVLERRSSELEPKAVCDAAARTSRPAAPAPVPSPAVQPSAPALSRPSDCERVWQDTDREVRALPSLNPQSSCADYRNRNDRYRSIADRVLNACGSASQQGQMVLRNVNAMDENYMRLCAASGGGGRGSTIR